MLKDCLTATRKLLLDSLLTFQNHNNGEVGGGDHCRDHGHVISNCNNNVEMLAREQGCFKHKVREVIKIQIQRPTIN